MIKQTLVIVITLIFGVIASAKSSSSIIIKKKGKGDPIILIHGMACSADVWDDLVSRYQDRYELHLVTIPGFGNNQPFESEHILRSIKDELITYVEKEKLDRPALMGHSMGGFLSLWAASERPDLFGKIVSVDGVPYFPSLAMPGMTPENAKPMIEQMQKNMQNQSPEQARAGQEMMISRMILNESRRAEVVEMGVNSNAKVIGQAMGEMYTTDLRDKVKSITNQVLVFGAWSAYKDFGATREITQMGYESQLNTIPDYKFLLADSAFHFIFFDEPEWFYSELDSFLNH